MGADRWRYTVLWVSAALLWCAGCATVYTADDQKNLADAFYAGDIDRAAEMAMAMSDGVAEQSDYNALLWHLEAGSTNLDAGRYDQARTALARAEQLIYYGPGEGAGRYQLPARGGSYRGTRSDQLNLNLLLFFLYLEQGKFEDAMVEIRRMRQAQFAYLLQDSDPELRQYEADNAGRGAVPLKLNRLMGPGRHHDAFNATGLPDYLTEYRRRKRPALPVMFNPMAFYLSALGYYWDNEFEEAVIDLYYLWRMDPENALFRRDYATVLKMLKDPVPQELAAETPWDHQLTDQFVLVLLAYGRPPAWENASYDFTLPDMVPATWQVCHPPQPEDGEGALTLKAGFGKVVYTAAPLFDYGMVSTEEYWQLALPAMLSGAVAEIESTTAAYKLAQVQLAAARAQLAAATTAEARAAAQALVASAQLLAEANRHAYICDTEWRRWSTLPAHWQALHLPVPAGRSFTVSVAGPDGRTLFRQQIELEKEVNRAVVYIREVSGRYLCKVWSSME